MKRNQIPCFEATVRRPLLGRPMDLLYQDNPNRGEYVAVAVRSNTGVESNPKHTDGLVATGTYLHNLRCNYKHVANNFYVKLEYECDLRRLQLFNIIDVFQAIWLPSSIKL